MKVDIDRLEAGLYKALDFINPSIIVLFIVGVSAFFGVATALYLMK